MIIAQIRIVLRWKILSCNLASFKHSIYHWNILFGIWKVYAIEMWHGVVHFFFYVLLFRLNLSYCNLNWIGRTCNIDTHMNWVHTQIFVKKKSLDHVKHTSEWNSIDWVDWKRLIVREDATEICEKWTNDTSNVFVLLLFIVWIPPVDWNGDNWRNNHIM